MQSSSSSPQIPIQILQNREIFRKQILDEKTSFLFESRRIKFRSLPCESSISNDLLIKNLISEETSDEISTFLSELLRRSCELQKNPSFFLNEKLPLLMLLWRKKAVWGIANIAGDSSKEIIEEIYQQKTVDKLWEMLRKKPLTEDLQYYNSLMDSQ